MEQKLILLELVRRLEENEGWWSVEQTIEQFIKDLDVSIEARNLPHSWMTINKFK